MDKRNLEPAQVKEPKASPKGGKVQGRGEPFGDLVTSSIEDSASNRISVNPNGRYS